VFGASTFQCNRPLTLVKAFNIGLNRAETLERRSAVSRTGAYHHGNLRTALVAAALELMAEKGVAGLSVAEAARRTGVSTGAPYRHFASRAALLSAAATVAGRELLAQLQAAVDDGREQGGGDGDEVSFAVEALAATARVYVTFALTRGAAFELVFADELQDFPDEERREVTRQVFDVLLWPAITVTGSPAGAERLLRSYTAVAHGYAYLPRSGFMRGYNTDVDLVAGEAADVVRILARSAAEDASAAAGSPQQTVY
jgi:AcrR family transcriptional regulator